MGGRPNLDHGEPPRRQKPVDKSGYVLLLFLGFFILMGIVVFIFLGPLFMFAGE